MGHRKKLKTAVALIKGLTSIIKATLSTKRNAKLHVSLFRATTLKLSAPPSDKRVAAVLSFGHGSRQTACACIQALMDRLHRTKNAYVALKCLFTVHSIITSGSFILQDQLSVYPSFGGTNFLNLSKFRDKSDPETWELSSWVRWYASIIESNLIVSRFLGHFLHHPLFTNNKDMEDKVLALLSRDLLGEIDVLVDFVEVVCQAPDSLHLQRKSLVYEVVRRVGEDYRIVQREIFVRVIEVGDRLLNLSFSELAQILGALQRFEDCREPLRALFVNRARNDALWEMIGERKMMVAELMREMAETKGVLRIGREDDSREGQRLDWSSSGGGPWDETSLLLTASTVIV